MTTFNEREKAFEKKYEHDQDLQFKVNARKNKLLGLWAAGLMGKSGADAEAYAKDVVLADYREARRQRRHREAGEGPRRRRQADGRPHHPQAGRASGGRGQGAAHEGDALGVFRETERSLAALGMTECCVANVSCHPERSEGPLPFPFGAR